MSIYRLQKKLLVAEKLYNYARFGAGETTLTTFFSMMARRKHFYHNEISKCSYLHIDKDYLATDQRIVNDLNKELVRINLCMNQNGIVSLLSYFMQVERSLASDYKEIITKGNYDFLTNLLLFESQLADIEECVEELKDMCLAYSEVDKEAEEIVLT